MLIANLTNLVLILLLSSANICFAEDNVILTVDITIPESQNYIDLPNIVVSGAVKENHIGYGIHIDEWTEFYVRS